MRGDLFFKKILPKSTVSFFCHWCYCLSGHRLKAVQTEFNSFSLGWFPSCSKIFFDILYVGLTICKLAICRVILSYRALLPVFF